MDNFVESFFYEVIFARMYVCFFVDTPEMVGDMLFEYIFEYFLIEVAYHDSIKVFLANEMREINLRFDQEYDIFC